MNIGAQGRGSFYQPLLPNAIWRPTMTGDMGHTRVDIYSKGGVTLEGIAARPEGLDHLPPAAVLCHPHPMLGGDMENPVMSAIDWTCMGEGGRKPEVQFQRGRGERGRV